MHKKHEHAGFRDTNTHNQAPDTHVISLCACWCVQEWVCMYLCVCGCMCLALKIVYPGVSKILPVCDVLWEFLRPNQKNKRLSHLWNIYEYG